MGALLELRSQLRNLQWFGEINRRGFVKITKKLDKKVPNTTTQHRYIATKVDPCPFARDTTITRVMAEVNRWLLALGDANQHDDARSERSVRSLGRASIKAMLQLPSALLDRLDQAIRSDDVKGLEECLCEGQIDLNEHQLEEPPAATVTPATERSMSSASSSPTPPLLASTASSQSLLLNLLQRATSVRSKKAVHFLLNHVQSIDEPDDINQRNCIHRLVIHIGRSRSAPQGVSTGNIAQPETTAAVKPFPHMNHFTTQYLKPATSPMPEALSAISETQPLTAEDVRVQMLIFLLDNLTKGQRHSLSTRDSFGRMPLHYAAQFGFVIVCRTIISRMQAWGQFNVENGIDAPEWQDKEGYAPLHLSVISGHPLTTEALLRSEDWQGVSESKGATRRRIAKSSAVLAIATKHDHSGIVQMLVDAGVDVNWQDETGETALHIAARFGYDKCAKILIAGSDTRKADLELAEKSFAWTPLHISAVDGHLSVATLLVEAGADVDKADSSGWTAREHAALRGHLDIGRLLMNHSRLPDKPAEIPLPADEGATDTPPNESAASLAHGHHLGTSPPKPEGHQSLGDRRSKGASRLASAHHDSSPPPQPVRTYGHRYLTDETLVLVSLGSMDMRKNVEAVQLDQVPLTAAHQTQLDTALSIVVSATGATGEASVIDLPVQENISTEPIVFTTKDVSGVTLNFNIVPTYSGNSKNKIGRAFALLPSVRPTIGLKRMNLQGDVCVPIISPELEIIGTVNFNFLVVTPFSHPNMSVKSDQTYWRKVSSTPMVIGHRGLGKNMASNRSLQLGENTVPSFIAAANLGANYVEFDVQLTKDHIPVIYHDFLVSETGIDAPVHTLTLEQFLHINDGGRSTNTGGDRSASPRNGEKALVNGSAIADGPAAAKNSVHFDADALNNGIGRKKEYRIPRRAMSMSLDDATSSHGNLNERMKHTRDFKAKGFKANSRGNFIQAPFATLEDLFQQVPSGVGFNIEMKYPMLHESEDHGMDTYAVELNSFCDTVLSKVYDLAHGRDVIFSSFNPDICLCLSFKQPNFPIMFLTDAGGEAVGDIRASSLQEAIRFARRWNLLGIVSLSEPFIISPRLVRVVKQSGLVCVSYGAQNNQPELVEVRFFSLFPSFPLSYIHPSYANTPQKQVKEGIDAVIVDSVLAIRKGLTKDEGKLAVPAEGTEERKSRPE